jgi:hypothetical protein
VPASLAALFSYQEGKSFFFTSFVSIDSCYEALIVLMKKNKVKALIECRIYHIYAAENHIASSPFISTELSSSDLLE